MSVVRLLFGARGGGGVLVCERGPHGGGALRLEGGYMHSSTFAMGAWELSSSRFYKSD